MEQASACNRGFSLGAEACSTLRWLTRRITYDYGLTYPRTPARTWGDAGEIL